MKTITKYICENCNASYDEKEEIKKCYLCGVDFCNNCNSESISLLYEFMSVFKLEDETRLCNKCELDFIEKPSTQRKYLEKIGREFKCLIDKFKDLKYIYKPTISK